MHAAHMAMQLRAAFSTKARSIVAQLLRALLHAMVLRETCRAAEARIEHVRACIGVRRKNNSAMSNKTFVEISCAKHSRVAREWV
jgi:hypothetical protein